MPLRPSSQSFPKVENPNGRGYAAMFLPPFGGSPRRQGPCGQFEFSSRGSLRLQGYCSLFDLFLFWGPGGGRGSNFDFSPLLVIRPSRPKIVPTSWVKTY